MFEQIPPDVNQKKVLAGIMGIILGAFGVHKFILGYTTEGVTMLLISILGSLLTCGLAAPVMGVFGLIEGIIYLSAPDDKFYETYLLNRKGWF